MTSAAPKQLLAEELRYYARSERHLRPFQAWLSEAAPSFPVRDADGAASDDPSGAEAARAIFPLLRTHTLGSVLLFSAALPSTQTLLRETLRPSPPAGLVCYTAHQLQGRGRGANSWVSPAGCLTFSFTSSLSDGATLPFVQYLVSLAILRAVDAVRPAGADASAPSPVRIKWPNDIYAGDKVKIGGMLCQSEFRDGKFSVTTGACSRRVDGCCGGGDRLTPVATTAMKVSASTSRTRSRRSVSRTSSARTRRHARSPSTCLSSGGLCVLSLLLTRAYRETDSVLVRSSDGD